MIGKIVNAVSHEKRNKSQSAITLIALVITIIVLLILAGITINAILGPNSIFDLAREARDKTKKATEEEEKNVESLSDYMNEILTGKKKIMPPTLVYAKLYEDGTFMLSTTDYIDKSKGNYTDYGEISKNIYSEQNPPEWASQPIKKVIIYDEIAPINTAAWFNREIDVNNEIDTIESIDLRNMNTCNVTNMDSMFRNCNNLKRFGFNLVQYK